MGQPVEFSDALASDERVVGESEERSIAWQIERRAAFGRIADPQMQDKDAEALKKGLAVKSLEECLSEIETPEGRQSVKDSLSAGPFPRYEAAEGKPGWLLRTEENGRQTVRRFACREFVQY